MHQGGCLCGAVRYEIAGDLAPIQICHCADCRRAQGSAFGANMPVALADFRLLQGDDHLCAYESSPGKDRVFCATCGGPIYSRFTGAPGVIRIRAGSLDAPTGATIGFHFHVSSKVDWSPAINDGLPQYPGERPKG
jgi:hypothetical protein